MVDIYTVYGTGGFAREVMPLLKYSCNENTDEQKKFFFIDDFKEKNEINGTQVLNFEDLLKNFSAHNIYCNIAIADANIRRKLSEKCMNNGINILTIKSKNSLILDDVQIDKGSILCPFTTITSNVRIGTSFHANLYSYVAHDCVIGDYVTFAPGVKCNGNVRIENNVYIGTGAIILPGTKAKPISIGENSRVAAGSVVTKSIPENVTVFGNPAQILTKTLLKKIRLNS